MRITGKFLALHNARVSSMQVIYSWHYNKISIMELALQYQLSFLPKNKKNKKFVIDIQTYNMLLNHFEENHHKINYFIKKYSDLEFIKIDITTLSILRMILTEIDSHKTELALLIKEANIIANEFQVGQKCSFITSILNKSFQDITRNLKL